MGLGAALMRPRGFSPQTVNRPARRKSITIFDVRDHNNTTIHRKQSHTRRATRPTPNPSSSGHVTLCHSRVPCPTSAPEPHDVVRNGFRRREKRMAIASESRALLPDERYSESDPVTQRHTQLRCLFRRPCNYSHTLICSAYWRDVVIWFLPLPTAASSPHPKTADG